MKNLTTYFVGLIVGCLFTIVGFKLNKQKPLSTLECPCEATEIVQDVIKHTNKEGITTITTYLDVSKCVAVKTNDNE